MTVVPQTTNICILNKNFLAKNTKKGLKFLPDILPHLSPSENTRVCNVYILFPSSFKPFVHHPLRPNVMLTGETIYCHLSEKLLSPPQTKLFFCFSFFPDSQFCHRGHRRVRAIMDGHVHRFGSICLVWGTPQHRALDPRRTASLSRVTCAARTRDPRSGKS